MLHSVIAPLLAAATIAGGPADPAPTAPPSVSPTGAVLIAGVVRDENGAPVPGPVSVSVMPRDVETGDTYPVVAHGIADENGQFQARVTDAATLTAIANRQHGWVETVTASDNAASASAGVRSIRVWEDNAGRMQVTPQSEARRAATERSEVAPVTPTLDLTVDAPIAGGTARAGNRACAVTPLWKVKSTDIESGWAVVGELNNAYNDGTKATFAYGRGGDRSTSFGVAVSVSHGSAAGSFSVTDEATISHSARVQFPAFKRRLARKMRTQFRYKRTIEERECPSTGVKDVRKTVRAIGWWGGTDTSVKQPEALDKCDPRAVYGWEGGSKFSRDRNSAVRYTYGAEAFGVALSTQSGFSRNVATEYEFGGRKSKKHYLCGPDGKTPATTAGRIFSGAQK